MRLGDDGSRLCDVEDCEFAATHTLVWIEAQCYCILHADMAVATANAIGFPTPARTLRKLTAAERVAAMAAEVE